MYRLFVNYGQIRIIQNRRRFYGTEYLNPDVWIKLIKPRQTRRQICGGQTVAGPQSHRSRNIVVLLFVRIDFINRLFNAAAYFIQVFADFGQNHAPVAVLKQLGADFFFQFFHIPGKVRLLHAVFQRGGGYVSGFGNGRKTQNFPKQNQLVANSHTFFLCSKILEYHIQLFDNEIKRRIVNCLNPFNQQILGGNPGH